jgi:glycosyltransferase involved in cell wall biosynthesis
MQQEPRALRICACFFPFPAEGAHIHVLSVVEILRAISDRLVVVSGRMPQGLSFGEGVNGRTLKVATHLRAYGKPLWLSALKWALKYVAGQVEMSYHVARVSRQADIMLFYEGAHHYLLPIIVAKLLRKKVVKYAPGRMAAVRSYPKVSVDHWASYIFRLLERVSFALSNRIIIPTLGNTGQIGMEKYKGKTSAAMYMFVADSFREKKDWQARDNVVGYVGRLVAIKGALQLAESIPLILQTKKDLRFLIVGDGVLMGDMKKCLEENGCLDKVRFAGWVPNELIPDYLNEMKFHVLPSPFESPGAINLEAMACGTVVIANGAGGIPDVVVENKTGFLMEDNKPRTIAAKVIEVMEHSGLEETRQQAAAFVRENYSRQRVVDNWRRILTEL